MKIDYFINKEILVVDDVNYTIYTMLFNPEYTREYEYWIETKEESLPKIKKVLRENGYTHGTLTRGEWEHKTKNGKVLCSALFQGWHKIFWDEEKELIVCEVEIPWDD